MPQTSTDWVFWAFSTILISFLLNVAAGLAANPISEALARRRNKKTVPMLSSRETSLSFLQQSAKPGDFVSIRAGGESFQGLDTVAFVAVPPSPSPSQKYTLDDLSKAIDNFRAAMERRDGEAPIFEDSNPLPPDTPMFPDDSVFSAPHDLFADNPSDFRWPSDLDEPELDKDQLVDVAQLIEPMTPVNTATVPMTTRMVSLRHPSRIGWLAATVFSAVALAVSWLATRLAAPAVIPVAVLLVAATLLIVSLALLVKYIRQRVQYETRP